MALEVRASLPYMAEIIDRREMVRDLCIAADPTYSRNRKWHRLVQSCEDAECILLVSQNGADARDISEDYFQWSVDFNIWSVVCKCPLLLSQLIPRPQLLLTFLYNVQAGDRSINSPSHGRQECSIHRSPTPPLPSTSEYGKRREICEPPATTTWSL